MISSRSKALEQRQRHGGHLRGASTISQRVAKNLFLWPGHVGAKGIEASYTVLIETFWNKRRFSGVSQHRGVWRRRHGVGAASLVLREAGGATFAPRSMSSRRGASHAQKYADNPTAYVEKRAWWIERQMMRLGAHHLDPVEDTP